MTARKSQRGMVLVTSLLLLIIVTILAVGMFRSFGMDEKIAGNSREKQRALNAAQTAEQYAEFWLSQGNATSGVVCAGPPITDPTLAVVCSNKMKDVAIDPAVVPWKIGTQEVGVNYVPSTPLPSDPATSAPMNVTDSTAANFYAGTPRFYIAYLGPPPSGLGSIYQINAVGYGGSANTVAVVESTYLVQTNIKDLGAL